MASSSMPRLTRTEPWDLMNAFTEQLMRQAASEQADARKVEMAPLELELLKERKKFEEGLRLENLPRELSIRTDDAEKRASSELGRNKDLTTHRMDENIRYGSTLYRKNLETDIELYGKNPSFFSQKFRGRSGSKENEDIVSDAAAIPSDITQEDFINDLKKRYPDKDVSLPYINKKTGKSFVKLLSKDTRGKEEEVEVPKSAQAPGQPIPPSEAAPKGDKAPASLSPSSGVPRGPWVNPWSDPPTLKEYPTRKVPEPGRALRRERVSDAEPDLDIDDSKKELMQGMYNAYRRAGFSHNGTKALIAEVGRENGFDPKLIFGSHSDPYNKATNIGAMSWQGSRGDAVKKELTARGLLRNGQIVPSQEALDTMAEFTANELGGTSSRLLSYLQNENVDYPTAAQALGRRYVKWRYDDPRYTSSHENRDQWYDRATMMFDMGKGKKKPQVQATADPDIFDVILDGVG